MSGVKALCLVPHFFGAGGYFGGSSSINAAKRRRRIVTRTIAQLKSLSVILDPTVLVYGVGDQSLVTPDVDVSARLDTPLRLVWLLFQDIEQQLDAYDYFLVVEDDILVPRGVIARMMSAAPDLGANEILFPNRLEFLHGLPLVPDLYFLQKWTGFSRDWNGERWHEAANPNSGFLFMNRAQMTSVCARNDFTKPEVGADSYTYVDAAFSRAHRDFRLLRERTIIPRHCLFHQDSWSVRHKVRIITAAKSHFSRYAREDLQWHRQGSI